MRHVTAHEPKLCTRVRIGTSRLSSILEFVWHARGGAESKEAARRRSPNTQVPFHRCKYDPDFSKFGHAPCASPHELSSEERRYVRTWVGVGLRAHPLCGRNAADQDRSMHRD